MKLPNWLSKKKKAEYKIDDVFTFAGHEFRVLDPVTMPKLRQHAVSMSDYEREWGIYKEDILAYQNVIIKETTFPDKWMGKDDLIKQLEEKLRSVNDLAETLVFSITQDYQYRPYVKTACHMILIDDEVAETMEGKYYDKKLELCQRHSEVEAFFLKIMKTFTINMATTTDISKMWESYPAKEVRIMESKLLSKIGKTIYSPGDI